MLQPLKKGDLVVMHTCGEAEHPDKNGRIWRCSSDEWTKGKGVYEQHLVNLESYSGPFLAKYLRKVNI